MNGPSFDLRLVASFVAVAEELHFGRAAERLRIAQPALSRQIARLEDQLGVPLLIRSSREVSLTPMGEQVLAAGRDILARASRARAAVEEGSGEVTVHVGPGLNPRISELLSSFSLAHPGIRLHLSTGSGTESSAAVAAGRADVGFDHAEGVPAELGYAAVHRPAAGLLCGLGHRLATRPAVAWTDLEGERLVFPPPGLFDGYVAFVRAHLRTYRVTCQEVVGAELSQLNYSRIATGPDVCVLSQFNIHTMVPYGVVWVPIRPTNRFEFGIVWDRNRLGPATRRLVRWVVAEAARVGPSDDLPSG